MLEPTLHQNVIEATVASRDHQHFERPRIEIAPLPEFVWQLVTTTLASRVQFLAELLSGRMPVEISTLFYGTQTDLFPAQPHELRASCSCSEMTPCPHIMALHYVLADAFERDPLLMFEMRGLPRQKLMAATHAIRLGYLQSRRPAPPEPSRPDAPRSDAPEVGTTPANDIGLDMGISPAGDPDQEAPEAHAPLAGAPDAASLALEAYDALPRRLPEALDPPEVPKQAAGPLRALREPAGWSEDETPGELLAPVLDAAARQARRLLVQPGVIRSLALKPAADLRLRYAHLLPAFPARSLLLRALECVALAQRAARGDDLEKVLEAFTALLAKPGLRVEVWRKLWIPATLRGQERIQVSMEALNSTAQAVTTALVALHPAGPTALAWVSMSPDATPEALRKARRGLMTELDGLIPAGASIELVTDRQPGDESLGEYLDILGWDYVLCGGEAAEASSPALLPLQERHGHGAEAFRVPARGVAPEALSGLSPAPLDRALWLQVLAREVLRQLGSTADPSAPTDEATDPVARGAQQFDDLAGLDTSEAIRWLRSSAEVLSGSPWLKGLFRAVEERRSPGAMG